MEKSDLLSSKNENLVKVENDDSRHVQPDGGARAWLVMIGSFLINGFVFGVINSFGTLQDSLCKELEAAGYGASSKSLTSFVGSLTIGITFLLSPISGILTDALGMRNTAMLGGAIATSGLLLSSFFTTNVYLLYFTYSFMFGCGASFAYTPSLAILSHYFNKYLGIVNGFVCAGSSVFTIITPFLLRFIVDNYGVHWAIRIAGILSFGISLCGLLFKPTPTTLIEPPIKQSEEGLKGMLKSLVQYEIWQNKRYLIWASGLPIALFGYFVPYAHINNYIKVNFPGKNQEIPVQCIGLTSMIGRLMFGKLGDLLKVNRIVLQQISFYSIGVVTMLIPFCNEFYQLILCSLGMGLFDGGFISLIGPVAYDLVGPKYTAQAIGCLLGLASVPVSVGPPIAALIFEKTNSWCLPFVLAGIPPIVGASIMFGIKFIKDKNRRKVYNSTSNLNGANFKPTNNASQQIALVTQDNP